ncbi:MAG: type I-A CRISPR-associated protein Cas4/Csa1 [Crenarchaeota archaeon]|nr:type I-A CRISPR-associated protein Cas4/Csa1 [Thermoproteota archaeon]
MFLDYKILKYLRTLRRENDVSENLRGWEWYREPVRPITDMVKLSVADISNRYCSTMRDIYLKYVANINARPSFSMIWGKAIHETFRSILETARKMLTEGEIMTGSELLEKFYEDNIIEVTIDLVLKNILKDRGELDNSDSQFSKIRKACINLAKFLLLQLASKIDVELAKNRMSIDLASRVLPFFTEFKIDGSLIGLKDCLKVDILYHNIVIELKCGKPEPFHKLALTGYALAIESDLEIPVDYGVLIYVNFSNGKLIPKIRVVPVVIDDELRKEFLELRDSAMEIILHERDPGLSESCPQDCPYITYCRGG